ncbi:hypothetical protein S58_69690 [Bradyrhizobium oligotrophicum S58]|uniref:Uncharacterized protein n=1 Tax=Bradyrhizobium oligotrophicum S58 TaxID=1245469 RepID=M5A235_9BRAD|nr:hypothetical protein S58_69690 [Bradyrhizobium oligotrophicum S58]
MQRTASGERATSIPFFLNKMIAQFRNGGGLDYRRIAPDIRIFVPTTDGTAASSAFATSGASIGL